MAIVRWKKSENHLKPFTVDACRVLSPVGMSMFCGRNVCLLRASILPLRHFSDNFGNYFDITVDVYAESDHRSLQWFTLLPAAALEFWRPIECVNF